MERWKAVPVFQAPLEGQGFSRHAFCGVTATLHWMLACGRSYPGSLRGDPVAQLPCLWLASLATIGGHCSSPSFVVLLTVLVLIARPPSLLRGFCENAHLPCRGGRVVQMRTEGAEVSQSVSKWLRRVGRPCSPEGGLTSAAHRRVWEVAASPLRINQALSSLTMMSPSLLMQRHLITYS